ncbi:MAG: aminoacetone oxidase family FAD-binding enzyme [Firmicutes bacterium HGW-Firmicutes-13]|nr:MAG: aminoacetone oxidase family FAD-binding enzyme [Firmicutes bacterium HGW-Firmicutes-13]
MMAAGKAAEEGAQVLLIEKMHGLGTKLLITGKGRCNVTNIGDRETFFNNINSNPKFMFSAFDTFNNLSLISFLEKNGVKTKVERGGRVFPESDRSKDVLNAFINYLKNNGVKIQTGLKAEEIMTEKGQVKGVKTGRGNILAESVILASGGSSYPRTGSTGDGYKMAAKVGHTVIPLRPGLVPLEIKEDWVMELQGLSLKNVELEAVSEEKIIDRQFGEMLFTHFGVSGPIVLSISTKAADVLDKGKSVILLLNLKPALSLEQLDKRLQRDFEKFSRKQFKNSLDELLPQKMIPVIIELSGIPGEKPVNQITVEERTKLAGLLTRLCLTVKKNRPLEEAIITRGGIKVNEVNPKTMESKIIKGLFFAGEVLDIDAYTGGFNLQCAFSTGYAAGKAAAKKRNRTGSI